MAVLQVLFCYGFFFVTASSFVRRPLCVWLFLFRNCIFPSRKTIMLIYLSGNLFCPEAGTLLSIPAVQYRLTFECIMIMLRNRESAKNPFIGASAVVIFVEDTTYRELLTRFPPLLSCSLPMVFPSTTQRFSNYISPIQPHQNCHYSVLFSISSVAIQRSFSLFNT